MNEMITNDKAKRQIKRDRCNEKLAKKVRTKHTEQSVLHLRRIIQQCCGTNDLFTAIDAYDRLYNDGDSKMEAQTFYNLLNLCEGISRSNEVHIGTPKNIKFDSTENQVDLNIGKKHEFTLEERKDHAFRIKAEMDRLGLALNETAYTAIIRILCRTFDLDQAENLIAQAEQCQQCKPKLRMYSCLISAYCEQNNLIGALKTWARMISIKRTNKTGREEIKIEPSEREYCTIMKCASRNGDVKVLERVFSEIADEVLVPSIETTYAIIDWFESEKAMKSVNELQTAAPSCLEVVNDLPPQRAPSMGPLQLHLYDNNKTMKWIIDREVSVDTVTGILKSGCLKGRRLKPVVLDNKAWKTMMDTNQSIVLHGELPAHGKITEYAGGGKGRKRIATEAEMERRANHWDAFLDFLKKSFGAPFNERLDSGTVADVPPLDIVIDGANIGYYKQNFSSAPRHVDYQQIDWVVQQLRNEGKKVLLFLHERHFSKSLMPKWAESIVNSWETDGILFKTPHGSNDDWFWMHAALWCGEGTMLLSNDEMRDHLFQMLVHRHFLRWKERHLARFTFGDFDKQVLMRPLIVVYPDVYSRRVQRVNDSSLVIPLPKKGDENRFLDGYHIAEGGVPDDETYICISLVDD